MRARAYGGKLESFLTLLTFPYPPASWPARPSYSQQSRVPRRLFHAVVGGVVSQPDGGVNTFVTKL